MLYNMELHDPGYMYIISLFYNIYDCNSRGVHGCSDVTGVPSFRLL